MLNILSVEKNETLTLVGYIIGAIIMFILSAIFIYLFYKSKKTDSYIREKYKEHHLWSFRGFWGENRSRILAFLGAAFFAISVLLLITGFFPHTTNQPSLETKNICNNIISLNLFYN